MAEEWRRNKYGGLFKVGESNKSTNDYMNDKIRGESKKEKKEYTAKDMKPRYEWNRGQMVTGYELNGIWLLKNDSPWATIREDEHLEPYRWVINETSDQVPVTTYTGVDWYDHYADDKVTYVHTFKEGKEKLIELANNKK